MLENDEFTEFMYKILEMSQNQILSYKKDLVGRYNFSLSFCFDLKNNENLGIIFLKSLCCFNFLEMIEITEEIINRWKKFNILKPVLFRLHIKNFENLYYSYKDNYTIVNFKFGGKNLSFPIEKINDN